MSLQIPEISRWPGREPRLRVAGKIQGERVVVLRDDKVSNQLYRKLQRHVQERAMANLLGTIPEILFAGAAREVDSVFSFERYKDVYSTAREPDAKISIIAPMDERKRWIGDVLRRANVKDECYVSLSDYPFAPWFRMRTMDGAAWAIALQSHLEHFDINILSLDYALLLAIHESEWDYEAFINAYEPSDANTHDSEE